MRREYRITKSTLGYNVYRKSEEDWLIRMEWLQRNTYTTNRDYARTFYTIWDAESALVLAKIKSKDENTEAD